MRKFLCTHPILLWAVSALLVLALLGAFRVEYDGGGFGGLLVITSAIWGWMYWLPHEVLFTLNTSLVAPFREVIAVIAGLLIAVAIDWAIGKIRARRQAQPSDDQSA